MKRKMLVLLTALLCAAMLTAPAGAYDYREDTFAASGEEARVKELLSDHGGVLDYERAVRVHRLEWEKFLAALEGDFAAALEEAPAVWYIPEVKEHNWAYVSVGADGYSTTSGGPAPPELTYLFEPETVDGLLDGETFDSVWLVSVLPVNETLVAALDGDEVRFIPYTSRPDLLLVENGNWYTAEELTKRLSDCMEIYSGDFTGGLRTIGVAVGVLAVVVILAAVIATILRKKKSC